MGDSSVIPTTLSVNPSLTIMSLASRLAAYLAGGEHGYFEAGGRVSRVWSGLGVLCGSSRVGEPLLPCARRAPQT